MGVQAEVDRRASYWRRFWPGADVEALGRDVAERYRAAVDAWGLAPSAFFGGGVVAVVAAEPARVLKVVPRGTGEDVALAAEAPALATWAAAGLAPEVLGTRDGGLTLLLERVLPGEPLDSPAGHAAVGPPLDARGRLTTIASVARRLHALPRPAAGVPHVSAIVAHWRATMADDPAELEDLLTPRATDVLTHGDLHGGNLLRAGDGWRVIDPHAAIGDPHLDVWALIDPDQTVHAPESAPGLVGHYAAAAGLDPARAARWVRLRATIEARDLAAATDADADDAAWAAWLRAVVAALADR